MGWYVVWPAWDDLNRGSTYLALLLRAGYDWELAHTISISILWWSRLPPPNFWIGAKVHCYSGCCSCLMPDQCLFLIYFVMTHSHTPMLPHADNFEGLCCQPRNIKYAIRNYSNAWQKGTQRKKRNMALLGAAGVGVNGPWVSASLTWNVKVQDLEEVS
jgi:hypothetical protein